MAPPPQTKPLSASRLSADARHYRHQIQTLAYVNLDQSNGGIIRNLGDSGMAIQAVAPLYVNQQVFLRFDLANPRVRLEATGRVAWADPVGRQGSSFLRFRSVPGAVERMDFRSTPGVGPALGRRCDFPLRQERQEAAELLFSSSVAAGDPF